MMEAVRLMMVVLISVVSSWGGIGGGIVFFAGCWFVMLIRAAVCAGVDDIFWLGCELFEFFFWGKVCSYFDNELVVLYLWLALVNQRTE